jgi:hypothetical protein
MFVLIHPDSDCLSQPKHVAMVFLNYKLFIDRIFVQLCLLYFVHTGMQELKEKSDDEPRPFLTSLFAIKYARVRWRDGDWLEGRLMS